MTAVKWGDVGPWLRASLTAFNSDYIGPWLKGYVIAVKCGYNGPLSRNNTSSFLYSVLNHGRGPLMYCFVRDVPFEIAYFTLIFQKRNFTSI